jgi:hypothetical protein
MKQVAKISVKELEEMAQQMYGTLVKADVDLAKKVLVLDMELHADGEAYLLEHGSGQNDIWGINLHPAKFGTDEFVEFDSMINLRPRQGNLSRSVEDPKIREAIIAFVDEVVHG